MEQESVSDDVIENRFSPQARDVIYRAREAVAQRASPTIDLPQMVIGIIRADPDRFARWLKPDWSIDRLERTVLSGYEDKPGLAGHIGLPASAGFSRMLKRGVQIADELGHQKVEPSHFLVALLEDSSSELARILADSGVQRTAVTEALRR